MMQTLDNLWLQYAQSSAYTKLNQRTKDDYSRHWHKFSATCGTGSITAHTIQQYLDGIIANNGLRTAHHARSALTVVYTWGKRMGLVDVNPTVEVRLPSVKFRQTVWEQKHLDKLRDAVLHNRYNLTDRERMAASVAWVCYMTAQRTTDVVAFKMSDVGKYDSNWYWYLTQSKTGTKLAVPLSTETYNLLKRLTDRSSDGSTFGCFTDVQLSKTFARIRVKLNLPDGIQVRDMRRTAITRMLDGGVSEDGIRAISGHKSAATTTPYKAIHNRRDNPAGLDAMRKVGMV